MLPAVHASSSSSSASVIINSIPVIQQKLLRLRHKPKTNKNKKYKLPFQYFVHKPPRVAYPAGSVQH